MSETSPAKTPTWWEDARDTRVVGRALKTALLVGTVLIVINQGDRLLSGHLTPGTLLKMALTFCVPYGVSTTSSVGAIREARSKS